MLTYQIVFERCITQFRSLSTPVSNLKAVTSKKATSVTRASPSTATAGSSVASSAQRAAETHIRENASGYCTTHCELTMVDMDSSGRDVVRKLAVDWGESSKGERSCRRPMLQAPFDGHDRRGRASSTLYARAPPVPWRQKPALLGTA